MRDTARTCVVDVTKRLIRIIKRSLAARDRAFGKFNKSFLAACAVVPVDTAAPSFTGVYLRNTERERERQRERERGGGIKRYSPPAYPEHLAFNYSILLPLSSFCSFLFTWLQLFIVPWPARGAAASNERRPKRE